MAIVDTLNKSSFIEAFKRFRPDNFTYYALEALYEYYEECSESIGENIEFDPIGICCEWAEYPSLYEMLKAYDKDELRELEDETTVIKVNEDCYLVMQY